MGFISSAATVTVQAKLTNAGKKKLYKSIEGDTGSFITKFALGDSDSNYVAIENGSGPVDSGHVPEPGTFISKPRSFAIYQGNYRPGVPVTFVNGTIGPTYRAGFPIGAGQPNVLTFVLTTEWPKDEPFQEEYWYVLHNPTSIEDEIFFQMFTCNMQYDSTNGTWYLVLRYTPGVGGINESLILASNGNETDIKISYTGKQTRKYGEIRLVVSS